MAKKTNRSFRKIKGNWRVAQKGGNFKQETELLKKTLKKKAKQTY